MKNKFLILLVLCLTGFYSCEMSLDELNVDPNNLTDANLNLMLPEAISQSVFNEGNNPNRIAGMVVQQLRGIDAQQLQYNNYQISQDAMDGYWGTGLYSGVLRSCTVIIDKAAEDEAPFYAGVAKIIMASQLGIATSFFGDIPYTEALKGTENLKPSYDTQESVYASVQTLLDQGIAEVSGGGYAGGDPIFDGSAEKWAAAANALKARYYMQTTKRNSGAAGSALTAVRNAFTSAADQPQFTFETSETANWALAKFGIERPSTLMFNDNFAAMLENDVRLPKYAIFDGTFWQYYSGASTDLVWAQNTSTIPLISYVELKFLEAEALARTGGTATEVSEALAAGITASQTACGVEDTDYVATQSDLAGLSDEQIIERIIVEAYKSYYGFAFHESWANFRRTGYPALVANPEGTNGLDPSGVVPRRFLYPNSESQTNLQNVDAAEARQGGALLDNTLWVFE